MFMDFLLILSLRKDVVSFSSAIRVARDWRRAMALLEDMEDQHVELNWCREQVLHPFCNVLQCLTSFRMFFFVLKEVLRRQNKE